MTRLLACVMTTWWLSLVAVGVPLQVFAQPGAPVAPVPQPPSQPGIAPGLPPGAPGGVPPRDQGRRTGTARIRGRIIAADTGQPLRRATVRAQAPEIREMVSTTTGPDGTYELKDLPTGRYTVSASKGAYATLSYGQTRATESGRPIEVKDNQTIDRIDLRLPRGGIITGVILDEFGEPMPDAQVTPLRQQYVAGRRRLMPVGRSASTNDIGAFRLFGLTPGSYYLSVTSRDLMVMMNNRSDDRSGYAPTYYPGTSDVASAQRVTVVAGQTLNDINLSLVPTQTAKVSGTVVDASGQPVRMGAVMAMVRGGVALPMMPSVGPIGPDGTFTVNGMAPGDYTLRATMPPDAVGGAGVTAMATVSISGQDVTGIQLAPAMPSAISGRIILDGGTAQSFQGTPPQLMFTSADPEDFGPGMSMPSRFTPRDDLTFDTKATAGRVVARLMTPDGRWSLKALRHQGVDVTDRGLDVRSGQDVSDVEVELTSQRQEISGLVTAAGGKPTSNYTAVIFPQDRELWTGPSRYIAVGRPDQEGRFRVRSLPAGDYHVVAVEYVEPGGWTDPDFLESVRHAATGVSLGDGETKTVDLRLTEPR